MITSQRAGPQSEHLRDRGVKLFHAKRAASLDDVAWIRRALVNSLHDLGLPSDTTNEILLSISELATNVVLHGRPAATNIEVEVALDKLMLRASIADDGGAFGNFAEAWSAAALGVVPHTAEGGRGIALARHAFDSAEYSAGPPNILVVQRRLVRQKPQVLIVEDDPLLLETYSSIVAPRYRVRVADNLSDALKIAQQTTIDLIVSDFHLGTEMGTALVRVLEDDLERPPIPFVMVTADPGARKVALELGVETFLLKPVSPASLIEAVELALVRSARRRARLFHYFSMSVDRLLTLALPPRMRGYAVEVRGRSADVGGGDLAIHLHLPDRDRIVLIDVMGHGIGARAGAVAQAAIIRALHAGESLSPGGFLSRWSRLIFDDSAFDEVFVTALVVDVLNDSSLEIASAGHPRPVLLGPDGTRQVQVDGQLLGFSPDAVYEAVRVTLEPSGRLLLVTDGFDPADLAGGASAPDWLVEPIADYSRPLDAAASAAASRAAERLGANPQDDWTLVVMERLATSQPAAA
jgi:DNA-binding response OmpR family regulator/anti-sigma regulatory factor (Ser/Thr protein kinase)